MNLLDYAKLCQESYAGSPRFTEVQDLAFAVIDCGESVAVCFRGSANALNWLRDLAAVPAETKNGRHAHHGFVAAQNALWDAVLDRIPADGRPIVYTGHSLGGAIAVLFAEHFGCQAVSFGSPRVWWGGEPVPELNHIRVVCDDDPVPLVPHLLFRHDATDAIKMLVDGDGEIVNPEDHCIGNYLDRLQKEPA